MPVTHEAAPVQEGMVDGAIHNAHIDDAVGSEPVPHNTNQAEVPATSHVVASDDDVISGEEIAKLMDAMCLEASVTAGPISEEQQSILAGIFALTLGAPSGSELLGD